MLHKSFKPAKCQTALKLASSRIKLLKNKRDAQVKQLKRELAQLLESGQDQTARIRVEHVVREEKTMAAYELIEIYCELIVARLPIIESQKNCPIDLKEAISSVIFASPRCADIPELMDVRKHFTAKYGKDFVSAAVELRPDCGVSRLLVEKLSAKAPDGPTKVKILSVIAEEHNIKWDPKSFEEKNNPPVDLLNGPNTFGQPSNSADKVPPNFEVTSQHHEKHDDPTSTFGPRTNYQNLRDGGSREMEVRYPENREASSFSMGKQAFKMEFADATAAAQAAAESAERASMAARAAAELSSRGSTQQSMEKQNHPAFMSQDDWIQSDLNPRLPSEYNGKHPANDFFDKKDSGKHHHELSDAELTERFYKLKNSNTSHQRIPSKPSGSPVDEHSTDDEDGSSSSRQCIDSERKSEGRFEYEKKSDRAAYFEEDLRQPSKDFSPDSFGHNHEDSMPSQFKPQNKDEDASELESPFITHEGETQRSSRDSNSQANAAAVFDDSGSDNELINLDGEENFRDSNYLSSEGGIPSSDFLGSTNIWSPRQKAAISLGKSDSHSPFVLEQQSSSSDLLGSANIWSRRQKAATLVLEQQPDTISKIVTSDTVTVEPDSSEAIVFDESDGENDLNKVTPGEKESSGDESRVKAKEYVGYNRQTELDHSSDDSEVEIHSQRDSRTEVHYGKTLDSRSGNKSQISQPFNSEDFDKREKKTQISLANYEPDTKYVRDSSSEAGNELNLGSLKGGLRNKGYKHPPYRRDASNLASTKRVQEDASNRIEQTSSVRKSEISSGVHDQGPDHQRLQKENREAHSTSAATYIDPNDEDSEDELQKRPSRTVQESFNRRASNDMNNKPYARTYFDSENSESEEDMMTPTLTTKHRPGTGVSRRTKASSLDSNRNKATSMQFETARTTEKGVERKSSSQSAYTSGSRHESQSQINNLNQWGNREQSQSSEQAASKKYPFPEESPRSISSSEKHGTESESKLDYRGRSAQPSLGDTGSYRRVMESKSSSSGKKLESSTRKSTSNPPASIVASSGSAESLKTPSRVNSHDQASHVHPKLPDYDTLSAHLLSLRRNQQ